MRVTRRTISSLCIGCVLALSGARDGAGQTIPERFGQGDAPSILVELVDPAGTPIGGVIARGQEAGLYARMKAAREGSQASVLAISDDVGLLEVPFCDRNEKLVTVCLEAKGFAPKRVALHPDMEGFRVVLDRGRTLTGTIRDAQGRGVGDAAILSLVGGMDPGCPSR